MGGGGGVETHTIESHDTHVLMVNSMVNSIRDHICILIDTISQIQLLKCSRQNPGRKKKKSIAMQHKRANKMGCIHQQSDIESSL